VRPLTVLTGIVLGSAAAATFSLVATLVVFGFLLDDHPQFRSEMPMLAVYTLAFLVMTVLAAVSFIGLVKDRPWWHWAQGALWGVLAAFLTAYLQMRLKR
jgi:hypothetical protein